MANKYEYVVHPFGRQDKEKRVSIYRIDPWDPRLKGMGWAPSRKRFLRTVRVPVELRGNEIERYIKTNKL